MEKEQKIILKPDWRSYFWYYFTGILLLPLFGAGIIILWLAQRKRSSEVYEIHNQLVRIRKNGDLAELNLVNIETVSVHQTWIEKKFNTGTVRLAGNVTVLDLAGMEQPENLASMIRQAIAVERKRLSDPKKRKPIEPEHNPGTLDKMDYLTGLWQQGLISNEDYEKEKKHFE